MNKLRREESFARLDDLHREAEAGAPDEFLAKEAEVSMNAVKKWRQANKLVRARGPRASEAKAQWALGFLGQPVEDVLMRSQRSPIRGEWEPPEYVLRGTVKYPDLVRQIHFLHRRGGFSPSTIAEAHGYTLRTVEHAIALGDRENNA
jgi:hypothetical protein